MNELYVYSEMCKKCYRTNYSSKAKALEQFEVLTFEEKMRNVCGCSDGMVEHWSSMVPDGVLTVRGDILYD